MGAFAVFKNKPEFYKCLLNKRNPFDPHYSEDSWFIYIFHKNRDNNITKYNMIDESLDFFKNNENNYVIKAFGSEEIFKKSLSQFDFIQFLTTIINGGKIEDNYYPSFCHFYKELTEPIIEIIINTYTTGTTEEWIPLIDKEQFKNIFKIFEQESNKCLKWYREDWNSDIIKNFLK